MDNRPYTASNFVISVQYPISDSIVDISQYNNNNNNTILFFPIGDVRLLLTSIRMINERVMDFRGPLH